jgi:hypothetical protein
LTRTEARAGTEAQVKADGGAELLTLLRGHLNLPIPEAHYDDLRDEARGRTQALGRDAHEDLGCVEHIATVLRLARGTNVPAAGTDLAEAADLLRTAARLRADALGEAV